MTEVVARVLLRCQVCVRCVRVGVRPSRTCTTCETLRIKRKARIHAPVVEGDRLSYLSANYDRLSCLDIGVPRAAFVQTYFKNPRICSSTGFSFVF